MHTFNLNIHDIFELAFQERSNKAFIITSSRTVTYGELKHKIGKYTSYLKQAGIKKGDRIVFSSKDEAFTCCFFLALIANEITAVLLDPDSGADRSTAIIEHCLPHSVFVDEELISKWNLASTSVQNIIPVIQTYRSSILDKILKKSEQGSNSFPASIEALPETTIARQINPESDAYILFTSGTTAAPKGVRISYRALFSHLQTLKKIYQLNADARIFNNLILSHTDGMTQGPVLTLFSNATLYRPHAFSIQRIEDTFDIIYREQISHWIMVPTMIALILQFKKSSDDTLDQKKFKYVISCAGKLESKFWREFENKFKTKIINGYGLTETVTGGIFAGPNDASHVIGSIGVPVDCDAKIADENGNEKSIGEHGEIWLRGSLLMTGYLNAPEANQEVFSGEWLKSGDIGYKGEDGCFRVVGRKKSIIISGGINISPEEVTEVLNTHPIVQDAVTFGVEDDIWGESLESAIVIKQPETLKQEDIIEFCRQHLEERKVPSRVYFMDELPRGRSGKVMLPDILEKIKDRQQESDTSTDLQTAFFQIVSRNFKMPVKNIDMNMHAEDTAAWDSLTHLVLIGALEKHFKITFTPLEVMKVKILAQLFTLVKNKSK